MKMKTGIVRKYHDKKRTILHKEYFMVNGKIEGEYKTYYDNGKLDSVYNFVNGKMEGEYKEYYSTGELQLICNYVNGKIEGEYKSYHRNGKIERLCNYVNGKKHGESKVYFDNGKIYNISNDINGEPNGEYKEYYYSQSRKDGSLYRIFNMKAIEKAKTGGFIIGVEGDYKAYWPNGNLWQRAYYINNVVQGKYNFYNKDGSFSHSK